MQEFDGVLKFWFDPENIPYHFAENPDFDEEIRRNFGEVLDRASQGLLWSWRRSIYGRLAEVIVLDQFSRNLYRGNWRSYSQDKLALVLAQEIISHRDFNLLDQEEKKFALMPFMHSENLEIHHLGLPYFEALGDPVSLDYARSHMEILEKFGRYPFRNEALGRESTPEELEAFGDRMGNFSHLNEEE